MNQEQQATPVTMAELIAMNQKLIEENKRLAAHAPTPKGPTLKVSAKGAISLYGLGRWPVTLYASQWEKIFESREAIVTFIHANLDKLAQKENA